MRLNEKNFFFPASLKVCHRHVRGSACEEQKPPGGCGAALTCGGGRNPHGSGPDIFSSSEWAVLPM